MHRRTSPPRLIGALVVTSLLLIPLLSSGTAAATADRESASSNSQWLAGLLPASGAYPNPMGGQFPDYGLTIDALYAMHASGDGDLAEPIARALDDDAAAVCYFAMMECLVPGLGYEGNITGGAAAKVLVAALVAGRDPRDFAGHDMVAEVIGAIQLDDVDYRGQVYDARGRLYDYAKDPGQYMFNNANLFGQTLAVIGLAGAGEPFGPNDPGGMATAQLVNQQCEEGYFRIFFSEERGFSHPDHPQVTARVQSCDEGKTTGHSAPDRDATGFALSALTAAQRAGAEGLDAPIERAITWLLSEQKDDDENGDGGGWGGGVSTEAPNTNSTGLIVQALAEYRCTDDDIQNAVERGRDYLRSAQVTEADAGTALGDHIGAIAYDPASYRSQKESGLVGRDTWIRASAQASLGLSQVGFYDLTQQNVVTATCPDDPEPGPGTRPGGQGGTGDGDGDGDGSGSGVAANVSDRAGAASPPPGSGPGTVVRPAEDQTQIEAGSPTPAGLLGEFLVGYLVDGDHVETEHEGDTYVDYAATADLVLALRALGEQPAAVRRASLFLLNDRSIDAYARGAAYEPQDAAYAEPLAKLVLIGSFLAADPDAPDDVAAVNDALAADLGALHDGSGEFEDQGRYADLTRSTTRHAWAVLASVAAGDKRAEDAAALLAQSICDDGTFPRDLAVGPCSAGDLETTAVAAQALNGTPTEALVLAAETDGDEAFAALPVAWTTDGPANDVPASWEVDRVAAISAAGQALVTRTNAGGLVFSDRRDPELGASSQVAAGRQALGLDGSVTAQTFAALQAADGGFAPDDEGVSDFTVTLDSAYGLAGRSWSAAPGSPVSSAIRLPLGSEENTAAPAAAEPLDPGPPGWVIGLLLTLALLVAATFGFALHHLTAGSATTTTPQENTP